ncbi:MAG: carbohydrate binding domain-containing protein [Desulfobacteraceae bacterium]|nr:carbohydrate binding domain-containing protein [Desulfobacteraceae bacterium]
MALRRGIMSRVTRRMLISVTLLCLAFSMLKWGLESRVVASRSYTQGMVQVLAEFPEALVRLGTEAWAIQDLSGAIRLLQRAVSLDPLNGGAWLRLAEVEKVSGNRDNAREILDYVHRLGGKTLRWTWSETLLALDLGAYPVVWENLNRMIENQRHTANALQLADVLLVREPETVDKRFEARNLPVYMKWLIRWGRLDQALGVREKMARKGLKDTKADASLSARLLARKRVPEALSLGGPGLGRLTNPGFEADITTEPFDWHFSDGGDRGWKIKRVAGTASEGSYSLSITFDGKKNGSFAHLSQIVPVEPGVSYRLRAWWKGDGLSTDQGPFLEVYGHDAKGLHVKGPMLIGTRDWEKVSVEFTAPEGCHAVVLRMRRNPSRKLDNKIKGTVWLDGFGMEVVS